MARSLDLRLAFTRLLLAGTALAATAAAAQVPAPPATANTGSEVVEGEILVTARRRAEADIATPVVITTFSGEELSRAGANDIYAIGAETPQLIIGPASGATGGIIALRGVASGPGNANEQSVSLIIDGVAISNANAVRIGQFDLGQVEILKGPQALFFGKNSPGGLLVFTSAGPGNELNGYLRTGYEFRADEWRSEAAVGGPLTDTLGVRVAGLYSTMKGYFDNPLQPGFRPGVVFGPSYSRAPNQDEIAGRLTVEWDPSDAFSATLKAAHNVVKGSPNYFATQIGFCPRGMPAGPMNIAGLGECEIDGTALPLGDPTPTQAALNPRFAGKPKERNRQTVASANLDWTVAEGLSLSSITGYYDVAVRSMSNLSGPIATIALAPDLDKRDWSEELRLTSDFGGKFDFMVGAYYQDSKLHYYPLTFLPGNTLAAPDYLIRGKAKSVFGQSSYDIFERFELSAGLRFTDEDKRIRVVQGGLDRTSNLVRRVTSVKDYSPEVTLNFRPTDDLTLFASYKEGFKSGSFTAAAATNYATVQEIDFGPERVDGFEVGLKARLADRALRINAAAYSYRYDDLQVTSFDPVRLGIRTINAAAAKVQGVEFDFNYRPAALEGFTIDGSVGYNDGQFEDYIAPCYQGQTVAQGCNLRSNGTRFTSRDLDGARLPYAPKWSANLNAAYDFAVGNGRGLQLGGGLRHQSSFNASGEISPQGVQDATTFLDAQVRLHAEDDRWELALIGRNLSNKIIALYANDTTLTGTAAGLPTGTPADLTVYPNRPRSVMLQLTLRPF